MHYWLANSIGSECEGRIQCTFAGIYDSDHPKNGKPLFSLQHKGTRFTQYATDLNNGQPRYVTRVVEDRDAATHKQDHRFFGDETYFEGEFMQDYSIEDVEDAAYSTNWGHITPYGEFNFYEYGRYPLVQTKEYSPDKYVPAYLTRYGLAMIKRALLGLDDTENIEKLADLTYETAQAFEVYAPAKESPADFLFINNQESNSYKGEDGIIYERYVFGLPENAEKFIEEHPEITDTGIYVSRDFKRYDKKSHILKKLKINDRYKKVLNLKTNDLIYIKPAAFDWSPTDINDLTITTADGQTVDLTDEIEKTKRKINVLKTAKMLAIGGTIVM